jgi:hypothetical protein
MLDHRKALMERGFCALANRGRTCCGYDVRPRQATGHMTKRWMTYAAAGGVQPGATGEDEGGGSEAKGRTTRTTRTTDGEERSILRDANVAAMPVVSDGKARWHRHGRHVRPVESSPSLAPKP